MARQRARQDRVGCCMLEKGCAAVLSVMLVNEALVLVESRRVLHTRERHAVQLGAGAHEYASYYHLINLPVVCDALPAGQGR